MPLKITKASEPIEVERLNMVIYAAPGLGKTSLSFTAEAPLLLDFDNGAYRAVNRGDAVRIADWNDVSNISGADLAAYKTVVVDTAGRALDSLSADIIRRNPKHGNGGALSLQGYGQLKSRFAAFLKHLNSFGLDVVLVAHMDEQRNGDDVLERLDMQGASKNEVYKAADAMGRLTIGNGERWLRFSPADAAFGKNPAQLDPLLIPAADTPDFDGFLGRVIQTTKDRLNALTEAQEEALKEQKWFREALPDVDDAGGVNALIPRAKDAGRAVQAMLASRAKELGLIFDKGVGQYLQPESKAA